MERVWIVSEELKGDSLPPQRFAEIRIVKSPQQLCEMLEPGERPVVMAPLSVLQGDHLPKTLATGLLPPCLNQERLTFAIRSLLQEAKLQHDLEAAENVAWNVSPSGVFDDPSIEFLGSSILEISTARELFDVEAVLLKACQTITAVREVRIRAYPDTASSREIDLYQLALPVQFQGQLKAHVYIRFPSMPEQDLVDKVSEAILNLSDAIALAVERDRMIAKAEETKTVWEASFDAVADPVVILDGENKVVRGNRAYAKFVNLPISRIHGRPMEEELIKGKTQESSSEWQLERSGRHYRVFFDPIRAPLGVGRFVLRFHDVTEERTLTEKILAKEQVAEMGILVGSVAHEINNPIGGILAIGQILMKDVSADTTLYQDVKNIVESAERCKKIIQTMLSLVRKSDEERQEVSVPDCIQSALDLLGSEAKRLQVKIQHRGVEFVPPVQANRNRLLQVFFHLFQQSLAAIAERKTRQSFEAFLRIQMIPGFGNLEVRIEDNGDPIKHEYEIQSSVAFTVSRMILEEHEVSYSFLKKEGKNIQRLIFSAPTSIAL